MIPGIGNKRQSATQNLKNFDKLDTFIDRNFTNILVAPSILAEVLSEKISNSSSQDLYARVVMHLATYTINTVTPQLVNLRLSTVDALNKDAGF